MTKKDRVVAKKLTVSLPFGIGALELETDQAERRAAWELYIELVTRVAVQPLEADQGSLREALDSLYQLFPRTRDILKQAGPDVGAAIDSVGGIAIAVLNQGLRPFMTKWHQKLKDWEVQRAPNVSPRDHENAWAECQAMRGELAQLRADLEQYAKALADVVGIKEQPTE